jgi:hypothetical protein
MRVRLLLLAGLKTVEITEHALGLKQVHFLHLLLVKSLLAEDMFGIHTVLHLCERLYTRLLTLLKEALSQISRLLSMPAAPLTAA